VSRHEKQLELETLLKVDGPGLAKTGAHRSGEGESDAMEINFFLHDIFPNRHTDSDHFANVRTVKQELRVLPGGDVLHQGSILYSVVTWNKTWDKTPHGYKHEEVTPHGRVVKNFTIVKRNHTRYGNGSEAGVVTRNPAPFVNVTVNRTVHQVNTGETAGPFKIAGTDEIVTEEVEVMVADPWDILVAHLALFVPLLIAWSIYVAYKEPRSMYLILLPVTLCYCLVAQHLVNQSLAIITGSPFGITSLQSFLLMVFTGVWFASVDQHLIDEEGGIRQYGPWLTVAVLFSIYQLFNHLVSFRCTLSERTVFNNLCPVATIILEAIAMPQALKPKTSIGVKVSMIAMVVGAILFSCQPGAFSGGGVSVASLMVVFVVIYRITQRLYLSTGKFRSLALLAFIDGFVCFLAATLPLLAGDRMFISSIHVWVTNPSILSLLIVSSITFTGQHIVSLALLRVGSATAYLVFMSLAGFIEVAAGIIFFGDDVFSSALSCMGLGISLASGVWYSTEVVWQPQADQGKAIVEHSSTY